MFTSLIIAPRAAFFPFFFLLAGIEVSSCSSSYASGPCCSSYASGPCCSSYASSPCCSSSLGGAEHKSQGALDLYYTKLIDLSLQSPKPC